LKNVKYAYVALLLLHDDVSRLRTMKG